MRDRRTQSALEGESKFFDVIERQYPSEGGGSSEEPQIVFKYSGIILTPQGREDAVRVSSIGRLCMMPCMMHEHESMTVF